MQFARSVTSVDLAATAPGARAGVLSAVKSVWTTVRQDAVVRRQQRAAVAQLESLDDTDLSDMGISRGEIEAIVPNGRH